MDHNRLLDRWDEVDAVVSVALELPAPDRRSYLEAECAGDPELLELVESLLSAEDTSGSFLDDRARKTMFASAARPPAGGRDPDRAGERIGPWILVRPIGRGGIGTVYLAERADGEFEQTVAIKVLRRGMDTDDVLARFRVERQILASLEHPNIARLIDGGATEDDRPYLVMELVEGETITEHADRHRLTVEQRLRLFVTVARAVQYAHGNLIVHRDIKPGNILVTPAGRVKLLDFGIAKLLDTPPEASLTRVGHRVMTPEWASPEQVNGDAITTASDVYQLGLLLYQLLSGILPYDPSSRSARELRRAIVEEDPDPPSVAARRSEKDGGRRHALLRGDLDTVVMKAIRKDPERRYPSVDRLVEDIDRHLSGRPVSARPDTWSYRAWKFHLRNRWAVPSAATAAVAAVLIVLGLLVHSSRLETERDIARVQAQKAEEVTDFLVGLFEASSPTEARGEALTARQILQRGAAQIERLSSEPDVQAELLTAMSRVYSALGMYDEALEYAERAVRQRRAEPETALASLAESHAQLAEVLHLRGDYDGAERHIRAALSIRRGLQPADPAAVAHSLNRLGRVHRHRGEHEAAESLYHAALAFRAELGGDHPEMIVGLNNLAAVLAAGERFDEAEGIYRDVVEAQRRRLTGDHPELAITLSNLGALYWTTGDFAAAEPLLREALDINVGVFGPDHPDVAASLSNLSWLLLENDAVSEAVEMRRRALAIARTSMGDEHVQTAMMAHNLATLLETVGNLDEAGALYREAGETLQHAGHHLASRPLAALGTLLARTGQPGDGAELLRAAFQAEREAGVEPARLAQVEGQLGEALADMGELEEAETHLRGAVRRLEAAAGPHAAPTVQARERLARLIPDHRNEGR